MEHDDDDDDDDDDGGGGGGVVAVVVDVVAVVDHHDDDADTNCQLKTTGSEVSFPCHLANAHQASPPAK